MSQSKKQSQESNHYFGKIELSIGENSLESYNEFIVKKFIQHANIQNRNKKGKEVKILDFGAGIGSLALIWKELSAQSVECLEIDPIQLGELTKRGFTCWNSLDKIPHKFDFIYTSNVLEHIEDDTKSLENLASILESNCRIGIYVPAFDILFSDLDRSVGHYRRYSKKKLVNKVSVSGFKVVYCQYVDSVGFFASLLIKILGWKSIGNIGSPRSLKIYDKFIFPLSRIIDRITLGRLLGKNIILIAEKSL
jgi:SAM-dependent methyltransferase